MEGGVLAIFKFFTSKFKTTNWSWEICKLPSN